MLKFLLKKGYAAFGRRYGYDTTYMAEVAESSTSAGLRLSLWPLLSQYRGPKSGRQVWAGPCLAQLWKGIVDLVRSWCWTWL